MSNYNSSEIEITFYDTTTAATSDKNSLEFIYPIQINDSNSNNFKFKLRCFFNERFIPSIRESRPFYENNKIKIEEKIRYIYANFLKKNGKEEFEFVLKVKQLNGDIDFELVK